MTFIRFQNTMVSNDSEVRLEDIEYETSQTRKYENGRIKHKLPFNSDLGLDGLKQILDAYFIPDKYDFRSVEEGVFEPEQVGFELYGYPPGNPHSAKRRKELSIYVKKHGEMPKPQVSVLMNGEDIEISYDGKPLTSTQVSELDMYIEGWAHPTAKIQQMDIPGTTFNPFVRTYDSRENTVYDPQVRKSDLFDLLAEVSRHG